MLIFLGDLHGWTDRLRELARQVQLPCTVVQVGDLGFGPELESHWPTLPFDVYAIGGNHENYDWLAPYTEVTEVLPRLHYVPRGVTLTLEGVRLGFMGGGESVDLAWRCKQGASKDWWAEERITEADIAKLADADIDVLVTHTPPQSVIWTLFPPLQPRDWGLPPDWTDVSAKMIDALWVQLGKPQIFCGHMHASKIFDKCRILDINEAVVYTP